MYSFSSQLIALILSVLQRFQLVNKEPLMSGLHMVKDIQ